MNIQYITLMALLLTILQSCGSPQADDLSAVSVKNDLTYGTSLNLSGAKIDPELRDATLIFYPHPTEVIGFEYWPKEPANPDEMSDWDRVFADLSYEDQFGRSVEFGHKIPKGFSSIETPFFNQSHKAKLFLQVIMGAGTAKNNVTKNIKRYETDIKNFINNQDLQADYNDIKAEQEQILRRYKCSYNLQSEVELDPIEGNVYYCQQTTLVGAIDAQVADEDFEEPVSEDQKPLKTFIPRFCDQIRPAYLVYDFNDDSEKIKQFEDYNRCKSLDSIKLNSYAGFMDSKKEFLSQYGCVTIKKVGKKKRKCHHPDFIDTDKEVIYPQTCSELAGFNPDTKQNEQYFTFEFEDKNLQRRFNDDLITKLNSGKCKDLHPQETLLNTKIQEQNAIKESAKGVGVDLYEAFKRFSGQQYLSTFGVKEEPLKDQITTLTFDEAGKITDMTVHAEILGLSPQEYSVKNEKIKNLENWVNQDGVSMLGFDILVDDNRSINIKASVDKTSSNVALFGVRLVGKAFLFDKTIKRPDTPFANQGVFKFEFDYNLK